VGVVGFAPGVLALDSAWKIVAGGCVLPGRSRPDVDWWICNNTYRQCEFTTSGSTLEHIKVLKDNCEMIPKKSYHPSQFSIVYMLRTQRQMKY
jgi:hypothetical protein